MLKLKPRDVIVVNGLEQVVVHAELLCVVTDAGNRISFLEGSSITTTNRTSDFKISPQVRAIIESSDLEDW